MNTQSPLPAPGAPLQHYVSIAPFDLQSVEAMTPEQSKVFQASQLRLMWWKFRRHRLALMSGIFLVALYLGILICEFLAPYNLHTRNMDYIYSPPQQVHLFHNGQFVGPFVYGRQMTLDMDTLKRNYMDKQDDVQRIRFFCKGDSYRFWGLIEGDRHLVCPAENGQLFLAGTDRLGRDVLSRIIYGARISLTIGLVGIAFSFVLGIVIGGLAGYHGGMSDLIVQRIIEVLQSIPSIPLWLALAAIMPITWSPILIYFGITVILGLLHWTGLARAVRSKLLALREEDYVLAAQLMGASSSRIIRRHLIPGFMSHLIATATISIPGMILGETALSFLGLGLRAPITSWGILLTEARSVSVIAFYPWLLLPILPVILVILAFNFLGDGLRDAADPYK
ncbi:ABC transporter permease subunit [Mesorhizobium sp. M2A.F.Ca.ET.037.01.1.1]|uniref:ABC transporter permease n=1 Tax=unclassified Mesorhizobium TaxID=325217 RepID=UPI000F74DFD4|nr:MULTISPECIES: ABC transporter permease [unclassified Mesorhizobium]RVC71134.1 ABC transporter permease subunit [Mesorhizobium sp. M00.F.Ca.ET.038.03.1.1]RVC80454.1 ABC transporter permease subunit [Mesorhizobium sp. M2A.F.Ca.ET.046.02.1.1]AZO36870.1 ABC transporter permease [Mesorhizobium sp. M2A.F.Ca.ET.046.03.2.1]RUX07019.1 ABC transporter permease subunit [Mesorhizobium sp. M2A.F.Ca.ET.037.01.1.1]RWA92269.1 MAG: ABC transporter permease subunit [Mesorhizobium sp.]